VGHSTDDTKCCLESFSAVPGWDAVTGLGSPNFGVISNLVINPDTPFPAIGAYPDGDSTTASTAAGGTDSHKDHNTLAATALVVSIISLCVAVYVTYGLLIHESDIDDRKRSIYNSVARSEA
jgi:hypothetical protein